MGMRKEIRLSGSGGQGILLAGRILAEAFGVYKGQNVVQNAAYGGQVRGGSSRADVLVSPPEEEIEFPEVMSADVLLAMTTEALDENIEIVKPGGWVIVDTTFVTKKVEKEGDVNVIDFPFTLRTKERLGNALPANVVILPVIAKICELAGREALQKSVARNFPKGKETLNLKALDFGYELLMEVSIARSERK
jgi:2-oxoglutarate ferredoxin oxidoreductase subunit gamma